MVQAVEAGELDATLDAVVQEALPTPKFSAVLARCTFPDVTHQGPIYPVSAAPTRRRSCHCCSPSIEDGLAGRRSACTDLRGVPLRRF